MFGVFPFGEDSAISANPAFMLANLLMLMLMLMIATLLTSQPTLHHPPTFVTKRELFFYILRPSDNCETGLTTAKVQ